jgi:hypothetical protein
MRKRIKKFQKKINTIINNINNNIKEDWLWNGRFVIRQNSYRYEDFPDNSGGMMTLSFYFIDTKTGKKKIYIDDYVCGTDLNSQDNLFRSRILWDINSFIVDYCKVWDEIPDPYKQAELEGRSPKYK